MKNKILQMIPAFILGFSLSATPSFAQYGQKPAGSLPAAISAVPGPINPRTGLPVGAPPDIGAIDNTTGLPVTNDPWISSDWTDPDITITNVEYDGIHAPDAAQSLREMFHDKFDILIAKGWTAPSGENIDPGNWTINLHLKNVTASEIFRAMNLLAENDNTPFHWKLFMNGKRPTVFLQVVPQLLPPGAHPVGTPAMDGPKQVMVYYVGDLIDGGMTFKDIAETLFDVNKQTFDEEIYIAIHEKTQLVVVKGTTEQLELIHSTMDAFKQKLEHNRRQPKDRVTGLPTDGGGSK